MNFIQIISGPTEHYVNLDFVESIHVGSDRMVIYFKDSQAEILDPVVISKVKQVINYNHYTITTE